MLDVCYMPMWAVIALCLVNFGSGYLFGRWNSGQSKG